jgi:hypothetical protein
MLIRDIDPVFVEQRFRLQVKNEHSGKSNSCYFYKTLKHTKLFCFRGI